MARKGHVISEMARKGRTHRDLSIHIEGELSEIKLRPIYYRPEMGIVKTRKLDESKKRCCSMK